MKKSGLSIRTFSALVSVLVFLTLFFPTPSFATTTAPASVKIPRLCVPEESGVQVLISGINTSVVAGNEFLLSGSVSNNEPFPVADALIMVQVEKLPKENTLSYEGASDVVDRFSIQSKVNLQPGSSVPFSHTWRVPKGLLTGTYRINAFLAHANGTPLSGPARVMVNVVGIEKATSWLDGSSLTINDKPVSANRVAVITSDAPVSVEVNINSIYSSSRDVVVTWKTSPFGLVDNTSLVAVSAKTVRIPAQGSVKVEHTISKVQESARWVVEVVDGSKKSIISFSLVQKGNPGVLLTNFGLTDFPVEGANQSGVFGCVMSVLPNAEQSERLLHLYLLNPDGSLFADLGSNTIKQNLTGVFSQKFSLRTDTKDTVTLHADIRDASGYVYSKSTVTYSCKSIKCDTGNMVDTLVKNLGMYSYYLLVGISLAGLLLSLYVVKRHKANDAL